MARITELKLKDIRCFEDEQTAELSRVTLLVGENSTGKSTFLGCYNAFATLSNMVDLGDQNHFDRAPFHMGKFDTIARSGKSEFGVSGKFENHIHSSAGFSFIRGENGELFERDVDFKFTREGGSEKHINISLLGHTGDSLRFKGPGFVFDLDRADISYIPASTWLSRNVRNGFLPYEGNQAMFRKRKGAVSQEEITEFVKFVNFFRSEMPLADKPSFPVEALEPGLPPRTRRYVSTPLHLEDTEANALSGKIGEQLGLLREITVKQSPEDPRTEILIRIDEENYNLIDVGYGVHSILPLLRLIQARSPKIFLLQQPEIHIHPVAQAQLAQHMAEGGHDFIIETHSDYLIDRFRICVMEGVLLPEELTIIYFEPSGSKGKSRIWSIHVDKQGNLLGVPDSYRSFFLRETQKLLGF